MAESSPLAHSPTLVSKPAGEGPAAERLPPGTPVGEYVIDRFLGAGAMGEVYAGLQPVIGKKVAIKLLKQEVGASRDGAERFKREARAVNQIDHPNVIDIFSFGRLDDGRLYLVMDLVEGKSLRKALAEGPLEVQQALDILDQIAGALDAAHARGVVHRDLKPDNVMLGSGGKIYVLDFGLAKLLSLDESAPPVSMLTGQGTWLGTPGYMAPEQWSADGAGPASDRYSLGVMAFELLSGSLPFAAPTLPQMMEQHFRAKVPALSTKGAIAASSKFDPVVTRAMAKDPQQRFPTAREMVEALRTVAGGPAAKRAAAEPPGKRAWLPAAAGVGVLGVSIAAFLVVRGDKAKQEAAQPRPSASPVSGMVRVEIMSMPQRADVYRNGGLVGRTPATLDLSPGAELAFEIRKPGYAIARHSMLMPAADTTLPVFELVPVNGFEGVWQLPTKELRAFKRTGEKVEVSKLESVNGQPQFYRHYELLPADGGVAFGTTEELVDQRAPYDPACHIPHKVEYQYDPQTDALVVRRERVAVDFKEGHCIIISSDLGGAEALTRVDRGVHDAHDTIAPVGRPDLGQQLNNSNGPTNDSLDNVYDKGQKDSAASQSKTVPVDQKQLDALDEKQQKAKPAPGKPGKQQKKAIRPVDIQGPQTKSKVPPPTVNAKQAPTKESSKVDPSKAGNADANPAVPNAPPQQAPQQPTPQQANQPAKPLKPRGDSQVAPQVAPQAQFPQQPIQKK